jgi:pimeloyl-ACP methyl ester carboxylesterase
MKLFLRITLAGLSLLFITANVQADAKAAVEFNKRYVDGPYGQIHVLESKPQARAALRTAMVCFTPNPASGRYYRMFMEELGRDRVMVAPDYPGLGESDPPPGPPDMSAYADAMATVIEELGYGEGGAGPVDVCGYHTGAYVALELAASRPDLVRKLLLMGIPFYSGPERQEQYDKNVVEKPIKEDLDSLQGSWDFAVTNREKGVTLERGYDNFVDVLKGKYRRHYAYHAVFTYPAEERAALVKQPVLILNTHGSLEAETRAMAPYFSKARLIEVPELHHGIFDVGPDILAAHARPFLDGVE